MRDDFIERGGREQARHNDAVDGTKNQRGGSKNRQQFNKCDAWQQPRTRQRELPADVAKRRQLSMFVVLGLALLLGVLAFALFAANISWIRAWPDQYFMPTLVLVLAGAFAFWAYRTGVQRLYLYAAFVLAAYVASFWLPFAFPIYVVVIGVGVMLVGLFMMVRFIQEHPKLSTSG